MINSYKDLFTSKIANNANHLHLGHVKILSNFPKCVIIVHENLSHCM